jgi:hypothetical protein
MQQHHHSIVERGHDTQVDDLGARELPIASRVASQLHFIPNRHAIATTDGLKSSYGGRHNVGVSPVSLVIKFWS